MILTILIAALVYAYFGFKTMVNYLILTAIFQVVIVMLKNRMHEDD